ncbi:unnamed protein product [Macrosiphum euphorbiae]|uniref:HAT C-terminal dimerisation domain-containing protein n=1 Tax=Macrosiphum euphorbiae TaxID=13131 RepID=A0AAV0WMW7_9HEMI|nr:unnamed protein product [Macrosiphum euphorbiae]
MFYSVQIDDITDITQKTQCSIILRFVNKNSGLVERFLGFHNVSDDHTAEGLFNLISSVLNEFDIEKNFSVSKSPPTNLLLYLTIENDSNIKTKNAINILNNCNSDLFPNVFKLLQILVTLPVTSCEAEISFSTLKRIKTYLRNSTSESRLNGLAALNIHYDIDVKSEEVIQRLSNLKRRLDFIL